jgi:hypothetical protein
MVTRLHGATPPWTPGQIVLAAATSAEILVDWGQTRDALARGHSELNPVIGPHPSPEWLALYNGLAIPGMLAVGAFLSPRWRTVWFVGLAVMQTVTVTRNVMLGFHVNF